MSRTILMAIAFFFASLSLAIRPDNPYGARLTDEQLHKITGRDSYTGAIYAGCAYSSTGQGQVVKSNCPPPGGRDPGVPSPILAIECVKCDNSSFWAGLAPEYGESGWKPDLSYQDCTNKWKRVGECQLDGSCQFYRTVQFCSGQFPRYTTQVGQPDPFPDDQ